MPVHCCAIWEDLALAAKIVREDLGVRRAVELRMVQVVRAPFALSSGQWPLFDVLARDLRRLFWPLNFLNFIKNLIGLPMRIINNLIRMLFHQILLIFQLFVLDLIRE